MMKPKNHWTRRLALLTLTLGTLAEGSALAALPQTSSNQRNSPDSSRREITQRFPQVRPNYGCTRLAQPTNITIQNENGVSIDRDVLEPTYVMLLTDPRTSRITQIHSSDPPLIGLIDSVRVEQVEPCNAAVVFPTPPDPEKPEESYQCFEVIVNGTLPIYAADNVSIRHRNDPVVRNRDFVFVVERSRDDNGTYWLHIRPVPGRRNTPTEAGWIIVDSDRVELEMLSEGVCDR